MSRSVGADCVFEWIVGPKCRHGRRWNWVLNKRRAVCEHKNKARANRANPNLKLTWETRDMDMKPDRYVWLWNYEINRTWTWSVRRTLRHDVARHANKDWKKTQTKYTQGAIYAAYALKAVWNLCDIDGFHNYLLKKKRQKQDLISWKWGGWWLKPCYHSYISVHDSKAQI